MSTEKSLLTYEEIVSLLRRSEDCSGLQVPLGIDADGAAHVVELGMHISSSHMILQGVCGSGKSKTLQFILKGLSQMYGRDLRVSCIDGKGVEVEGYYKTLLSCTKSAKPKLMVGSESADEVAELLKIILNRLESKTEDYRELLILDDIEHYVRTYPLKYERLLSDIAVLGPRKNLHILYAAQASASASISRIYSVIKFDLICATRVSEESSIKLFGTNIASKEGGTRKYGDITYKYNNNVSRVMVPFCDKHL